MDRQRWQSIRTVFDAAVELPPANRDGFLADTCGGDAELRREVASLLAAHDAGPGLLDETGPDLAARLEWGVDGLDAEDDALPGHLVDHYRIEERIGAGGMGVVYRAVREDGRFRRAAALKVVKRGMDTESVLERFRAERRILASLEHEGIARLYDGGMTEDGRPYFVMELVEGLPIHRYCRERDASLSERLELFRQVCAAVDYAHRNLVVHRDLKPSNVLVTETGRVKLLDFGIAKLLDDDDPDALPATRVGQRPLTPLYACPEQIRGERITTAADVYGLGILLYELLAGRNPHQPDDDATAFDALRAAAETDPAPPSRVADRWRRRLRGDLDTIVLKALHREPDRRYGSPQALADDIARHLEGRPVTAHRDSLGYRLRKFVRRNRTVTAVTAVAFLVVLGFAIGMSILAGRNARQAVEIRAERDRAEEITGVLVSMFDLSDPYGTGIVRGDTLSVRDFLRHHQSTLLQGTAEPSLLTAETAHLQARLNGNLGLYEDALPLIERAVDIRRRLQGDSHPDLALSIDYLGTVQQGLGDFIHAEAAFRLALDMRRRLLGDRHLDVAESLNNLSVVLSLLDRNDEALDCDREALDIRRERLGNDHPEVAQSLNNLGVSLYYAGDLDAAEPLYREALAIRRAKLGDEHPFVANTLCNLARLLRDRSRHEESERHFREAIRVWTLSLGETHPQLSTGWYNLGFVVELRGDPAGAADAFRRGNDIDRATLPARHVYIADSGFQVGRMLMETGAADEAETWLAEAADIYAEQYGESAGETAEARELLAACRRDEGGAP